MTESINTPEREARKRETLGSKDTPRSARPEAVEGITFVRINFSTRYLDIMYYIYIYIYKCECEPDFQGRINF